MVRTGVRPVQAYMVYRRYGYFKYDYLVRIYRRRSYRWGKYLYAVKQDRDEDAAQHRAAVPRGLAV